MVFSTNNNRRLHLKMQARGVKHNRTLYVLRQQRKGRGVTMVSTNNNKKSSWKQVRRSDQLRYPIHNRSFIAHGRLWMPCAPASTIKDKNQGYSLSEPAGSVSLEQTVTHTHNTHTHTLTHVFENQSAPSLTLVCKMHVNITQTNTFGNSKTSKCSECQHSKGLLLQRCPQTKIPFPCRFGCWNCLTAVPKHTCRDQFRTTAQDRQQCNLNVDAEIVWQLCLNMPMTNAWQQHRADKVPLEIEDTCSGQYQPHCS